MMSGELSLNSAEIFTIGEKLDKKLHDDGVQQMSELVIKVNSNELHKIDEDLYYRNHDKDSKDEYVPSEGKIIVRFKNLIIKIIDDGKKTDIKV